MSIFTSAINMTAQPIFANMTKERADKGVRDAIASNDAYTAKAINAINSTTAEQIKATRTGTQQATRAVNAGATQSRADINRGSQAGVGALERGLQSQQKTLSPYTKLGSSAIPALMNLLGLGKGGVGGIEKQLASMPGYQFAKSQGIGATEAAAGSMGMGLSGNTLEGLDKFSTGLADQTYQQEVGNLTGAAQMGQQASTTLAADQGATAAGIANIDLGQGTALADIAGSQGTELANLFSGQAANLSNIYGAQGTTLANLYSGEGINDAGLLAGKGVNDANIMANLAKSEATSLGSMGAAIDKYYKI